MGDPTQHAKMSPSSMSRYCACPGSFKLTMQHAAESDENVYTIEGTKAHEVGELCLTHDKTPDEFCDDDEMIHHVQSYVDYINEITLRNGGQRYVEIKLDLSSFIPESFGTADCIVVNEATGEVDVADLKYGKHVLVSARENVQLLCYGIGAVLKYLGSLDKVKKLRMHICQPRRDHWDYWEVEPEAIMYWYNYIYMRSRDAWYGKYEFNEGNHCTFCKKKVKAVCPIKVNRMEWAAFADFDKKIEDLPQIYAEALKISSWVELVKKLAKETGVASKASRSKREWKKDLSEKEIVDFISQIGYSVTEVDLIESKLRSPAQVESMLKKAGISKKELDSVMQQLIESAEEGESSQEDV